MTPDVKRKMLNLYKEFAGACKGYKMTWIPVAGSLLAVHRHNQWLIPWDDDVDVAIAQSDEARFKRLVDGGYFGSLKVAFCGYRDEEKGYLYKLFTTDPDKVYKTFTDDRAGNAVTFNFPFIDVWIECLDPNDPQMSVKPVCPEEPLQTTTLECGLRVLVPTSGPRSKAAFSDRHDLMGAHVDCTWVHCEQKHVPIIS